MGLLYTVLAIQKEMGQYKQGNNLADRVAKEAAMTPVLTPVLEDPGPPALS